MKLICFVSSIFLKNSPISTPLGTMASSCLQQRESYHPYMFHDPLSLSAQYAAHPSRHHTPCNPTVAHQQPQHGNYGNPASVGSNSNLNSSTSSTGTHVAQYGTLNFNSKFIHNFNQFFPFLFVYCGLFVGLISAGISVPIQISTPSTDISGSYWSRLQ